MWGGEARGELGDVASYDGSTAGACRFMLSLPRPGDRRLATGTR
jgi:hypothetical protein